MEPVRIGSARCSTDPQDLTAQRSALARLGVERERIFTDRGLTGRSPACPALIRRYLGVKMRIATWNINGVNARRDELVDWLSKNQPDVIGLQEIKTDEARFRERHMPVLEKEGYFVAFRGEPRYNGVAILSKQHLEVTQRGLPGQERVGARLLTANTAGLSFTTVCVPSASNRDIERKLEWLDTLSQHLRERKTEDVPAVLCGDFNITPKSIDNYHHWEGSGERRDRPAFREDERSRIRSLFEAGWCDLVREKNPNERMFGYWSSPKLYNEDKGLRIDLVLGNAAVVKRLQRVWIDRGHYADRGKTGSPDHAPVVVDLA